MTIINNTFQFIFVHVPKAAGTSITSVLSRYTKYCDLEIGGTDFGEKLQPAYLRRFGLAKHSRASEIRNIVGPLTWSRCFTFAFVRNPFARSLSTYHFLRKWEGLNEDFANKIRAFESFDEYILSDLFDESLGPDQMFRPQIFWLRAAPGKPELLVDFVGRVETMNEDMVHVLNKIGLQEGAAQLSQMPRLNQSAKAAALNPENHAVIEKIVRRYKVDFETFGYSTDPSTMLSESST